MEESTCTISPLVLSASAGIFFRIGRGTHYVEGTGGGVRVKSVGRCPAWAILLTRTTLIAKASGLTTPVPIRPI